MYDRCNLALYYYQSESHSSVFVNTPGHHVCLGTCNPRIWFFPHKMPLWIEAKASHILLVCPASRSSSQERKQAAQGRDWRPPSQGKAAAMKVSSVNGRRPDRASPPF